MKRLGQRIAGQEGKRAGRIAKDIESACSLDILAIKQGSVAVQLSLPAPQAQPPLFGDTGVQAIERLLDGMTMLSNKSSGWPTDFDPSVTDPMLEVGRILNHGVKEIEFAYGPKTLRRRIVKYTPKLRTRIEKQIEAPTPAQITISGFLLEVDFKDKTAEIHEPLGNIVRIAFDKELEDVLLSGAKKHVKVIGLCERDHAGKIGKVKIHHLEIVEQANAPLATESPLLFQKLSTTVDPFSNAQPLMNVGAFFGGFPDNRKAEEIIKDLRSSRKPRDLNQ